MAPLTEPIFDLVVTIVAESQTQVGVVMVVGGDDAHSILPLFINRFILKAILITSIFSPSYCECK